MRSEGGGSLDSDGLTVHLAAVKLGTYLKDSGTPGRGITASVKVIDRPPLPPPHSIGALATMTAARKVCIPGLDHSLCSEGGLLLWVQTEGYRPPTRRADGKRSKVKTAARWDNGPHTGQEALWEDMA